MERDEVASRVNVANQKIRIEFYRKNAPGWWWYFCKQVKGMLADPLLEGKVDEICYEFYGTSVERMKEVISLAPDFRHHLVPTATQVADFVKRAAILGEQKKRAPMSPAEILSEQKKAKSAAERAKAYRERKKEGK